MLLTIVFFKTLWCPTCCMSQWFPFPCYSSSVLTMALLHTAGISLLHPPPVLRYLLPGDMQMRSPWLYVSVLSLLVAVVSSVFWGNGLRWSAELQVFQEIPWKESEEGRVGKEKVNCNEATTQAPGTDGPADSDWGKGAELLTSVGEAVRISQLQPKNWGGNLPKGLEINMLLKHGWNETRAGKQEEAYVEGVGQENAQIPVQGWALGNFGKIHTLCGL